jgi:holliday junction DNA helicase RuvA
MYAYITGKFNEKTAASVIVDVNGIGYELHISLNTWIAIQNLEQGKLYTHLQIKEDAHTLFGFADKAEKEMFLSLIGVSGIGANTGRMMLSSMKPAEIAHAITQGNVKLLESIKGIGKKTAERVVLELKDRLAKHPVMDTNSPVLRNSYEQDALNALTALGISRQQAEPAIKKILAAEPELKNLEEIIKKSLKAI